MSISYTLLKSELLAHLGIDATDLDATGTAVIDLTINRAWWEVADVFDFKEKETLTTFPTVAGTRSYVIITALSETADEAIQSVSYKDPNTLEHIVVDRTSFNWYEENYNEQTSLRAAPIKWFHYNGFMYLYPTPDQIYTITVYHKTVLADLSGTSAPVIPQNWHEAILYGAIKRGFLRARDFTSANYWDTEYRKKLQMSQTTDAKEDAEDKMASARVLRNPYNVRQR
jgi:hypothetical protein